MKQEERLIKLNEVKEYVRKNYFNNDISKECLEAEDISLFIAEFTKCTVSDLEWYTFKDVEDNLEFLYESISEIEYRYNEKINTQVVLSDEDIEFISKELSSNYAGVTFNKDFNDLDYHDINTLLVVDDMDNLSLLFGHEVDDKIDDEILKCIFDEIGSNRDILSVKSKLLTGHKNTNRELQVFKVESHAGNEMWNSTDIVLMED